MYQSVNELTFVGVCLCIQELGCSTILRTCCGGGNWRSKLICSKQLSSKVEDSWACNFLMWRSNSTTVLFPPVPPSPLLPTHPASSISHSFYLQIAAVQKLRKVYIWVGCLLNSCLTELYTLLKIGNDLYSFVAENCSSPATAIPVNAVAAEQQQQTVTTAAEKEFTGIDENGNGTGKESSHNEDSDLPERYGTFCV